MMSWMSGILDQTDVPLGMPKSVLTQNPHPTPSTQQAEQASLAHEHIPNHASQFP
jgi:hypothetical protein